jgi:hypothetical protein
MLANSNQNEVGSIKASSYVILCGHLNSYRGKKRGRLAEELMKWKVDAEVHWLVRNQKETSVLENI